MGWIGVTHVRRHHQHYHTRGGGHLYQGRFKSFPVQDDHHFRTVCRYVEANARRAGLVRRAEQWGWSSLAQPPAPTAESRPWPTLAEWPMPKPQDWLDRVNEPMSKQQREALQTSVIRGRPYGQADWVADTAKRLNLTHTLRDPGRPPKKPKEPKPEK